MSQIADVTEDLQELKKLRDIAQRKSIQDLLDIQIRKTTENLDRLKQKEIQQNSASNETKSSAKDSAAKVYTVTLRTYSWDQSDKFMKLYVTIPNLKQSDEDKVNCNFGDRSCSLTVNEVDGKNFVLIINNLAKQIVPEKSYTKVKSDMVVVMLNKDRPGMAWPAVTAEEVKLKEKNKPEKPEVNNADPSAGIMGLMKKMYDEGDEKTKQMLNKTWYESQQKSKGGMAGLGDMPSFDDI